jgi:hypothetical protein
MTGAGVRPCGYYTIAPFGAIWEHGAMDTSSLFRLQQVLSKSFADFLLALVLFC